MLDMIFLSFYGLLNGFFPHLISPLRRVRSLRLIFFSPASCILNFVIVFLGSCGLFSVILLSMASFSVGTAVLDLRAGFPFFFVL